MDHNIISVEEAINYPEGIPHSANVNIELNFVDGLNGSYIYYKAADTGFHNNEQRAYSINKGKVKIENGKALLRLYPVGIYKKHWDNYNYSRKHVHYRIIFPDNTLSEVFTIYVD